MALDAEYREFVAEQPAATLWHEADFLTCLGAEGGRWTYVAARDERSGALVAALPAYVKRHLRGLVRTVTLPPLVRYCGPLFAAGLPPAERQRAADRLVEAARGLGLRFAQAWPPHTAGLLDDRDGVHGLHVRPRATYFFDVTGGPDAILARAHKSNRRRLRRALEHFTVERARATLEDAAMLRTPFARQGLKRAPYDEAELLHAAELLHVRDQATCVRVRTAEGRLAASLIALRDRHRGYLWVTGADRTAGNGMAGSLAYYGGLCWAGEAGLTEVDALGSDDPQRAAHRMRLGARRRAYAELRA